MHDCPEDLTVKSTSAPPTPAPSVPSDKPSPVLNPNSVVGELMDRFGFTNLQQYSDAYRQAVKESLSKNSVVGVGGVVGSVATLSDSLSTGNLNGFDKTLRLRDDLVAKGLLMGGGHHGNQQQHHHHHHHHHATLPTALSSAALPSLPSLDLSHLTMPSAKRSFSLQLDLNRLLIRPIYSPITISLS